MGFVLKVIVNKVILSDHTEIKVSEVKGAISELFLDIYIDRASCKSLFHA